MGYYINVEGLLNERSNGYIGKPQFAELLVRAGYISHPKEAFESTKFFGGEPLKSIKKVKVSVEEAINMINDAGGTAVIAHPIQLYNLRGCGGEDEAVFFSRIESCPKRRGRRSIWGSRSYRKIGNGMAHYWKCA